MGTKDTLAATTCRGRVRHLLLANRPTCPLRCVHLDITFLHPRKAITGVVVVITVGLLLLLILVTLLISNACRLIHLAYHHLSSRWEEVICIMMVSNLFIKDRGSINLKKTLLYGERST